MWFSANQAKWIAEQELQRKQIEALKNPPTESKRDPVAETAEERERLWNLVVQSAKN